MPCASGINIHAQNDCPNSHSTICSTQVRVVQGPGPQVVRPPGGLQHAAGDWGTGVHRLPLQWLVHGHRDWREGLLRQLALQHSGGRASCQNWESCSVGKNQRHRLTEALCRGEHVLCHQMTQSEASLLSNYAHGKESWAVIKCTILY